jgi:hypothetical protein
VYVGDPDGPEDDPSERNLLPVDLIQAIATALKWVVLIIAAIAVALLALRLARQYQAPSRRPAHKQTPSPTPPQQADEPISVALPLDIPAEVRRLLDDGDARGALSLLYRAQIAQLRTAGLDLPNSATEAECLGAAAAKAPAEQTDWLRRLVQLWQPLAYGHRPASAAAVAALLASHPDHAPPEVRRG